MRNHLNHKIIKIIFLALNLALVCSAFASNEPKEQIQMRHCLADKLPTHYPVLAEDKHYKILEVPSKDLINITKSADHANCGRFVNVSDTISGKTLLSRQQLAAKLLKKPAPPSLLSADLPKTFAIEHEISVYTAIEKIKIENILATLTHLTSYKNRGATEDTGVEAAEWIEQKFQDMAISANRSNTRTWRIETGGRYKQASIVTVIGSNLRTPAVVIGAHIDTLETGTMPGADDDGSGSATIMEMARIILESSEPLKNPIYFIWYAAEEKGLVGSRRVVQDFLSKNRRVKAVIQFDMTGYRPRATDATMYVFDDRYVSKTLSRFLSSLITTYVNVPVGVSRCGYACSDHASWADRGFPVVFPAEAKFEETNNAIHSPRDTMDRLNSEHMINFTKLGLAFAIEMAFA